MNAVSLPARIGYAVVALPLGGAAAFYPSMILLPRLAGAPAHPGPALDNFAVFKLAVCIGAVIAFTASLVALTLPWIRHRKRRGRTMRILLSSVLVIVGAAGVAGQGYPLAVDLTFAVWLAYTLTFTFVRYGVLNEAKRKSSRM